MVIQEKIHINIPLNEKLEMDADRILERMDTDKVRM